MGSLSLAVLPLCLAAAPFVMAQGAAKQSPFAGSYSGCVEHQYSYVGSDGVAYTYSSGFVLAIKIGKNGHVSGDYGDCYNGSPGALYASVAGRVSDDGSMSIEVSYVVPAECYPPRTAA